MFGQNQGVLAWTTIKHHIWCMKQVVTVTWWHISPNTVIILTCDYKMHFTWGADSQIIKDFNGNLFIIKVWHSTLCSIGFPANGTRANVVATEPLIISRYGGDREFIIDLRSRQYIWKKTYDLIVHQAPKGSLENPWLNSEMFSFCGNDKQFSLITILT